MYDLIKNSGFDIFDAVLGFDYPKNLSFNCKVKDMMPSKWEKSDGGYKCTCRTVGINPKDVVVKLEEEKNYISVGGQTEMDGYKYNTNYILPISEDIIKNIDKIRYKSQNGITLIYVDIIKKDVKPINIYME